MNNRVDEVQSEVDRFKTDMDEYFARLSNEDDPSRLATMVEAMPDLPSFDAWADLGSIDDVVPEVEAEVDEAPGRGGRRGRGRGRAGEAVAELVEDDLGPTKPRPKWPRRSKPSRRPSHRLRRGR